jgi:cobalt-zinc-cadmium efflux system outer membrane protein
MVLIVAALALSIGTIAAPKASTFSHQNACFSKFIHQVWRSNAQIQSAKAQVESAKSNFSQSSKPIYNPNLDLESQYVFKDQREDTYTAGISQTIDLFNKRGARTEVGEHNLVVTKANLLVQQLALATKALSALAEYRMDEAIVKLAMHRTQLLHQFQKESDRKFKAGDIAQNELDQASLAYSEAISQQADEEINLTRARQRLIAVTQSASRNWPRLPNKLFTPIRASSFKQQQWLRNLPIIRFYSAQVDAAQAAVRVAQTETKADPTISIRGGMEDNGALVGAGLSIPLFVRNNFHDQVQAASHEAAAIDLARMNAYRESKIALQESLVRYRILYHATLDWNKASKNSLKGGIRLLNRLWSAGEINTTDYLIQLKQRIDSQIAGAKLKGQAWEAWAFMMQRSGQLNL